MGCCCLKGALAFFLLSGVALAILIGYLQKDEPITIPDTAYWGPIKLKKGGALPKDDEKIYNFKVTYDNNMINNLKAELERTKWFDPLEDANFHYGVNLESFRNVIDHWKNKFDFQKAQDEINSYPNYQTQIEGLKIHFFRSPPAVSDPSVKVLPLLMVHGWPGSFVEFLKVAKMLSKPVDGVAFDVIVPSLPGYGYSQASTKQGMDVLVTARIFKKLMARLGYNKFYMQGGDWGSAVTNAMAALYPEQLRGMHINMVFQGSHKPLSAIKMFLFAMFPKQFGDGQLPPCMPTPYGQFMLGMLRESGYMHIQSTKPDTIGFGLLNSPAGLAAYIIEKFSTWTQNNFRELKDGGLTKKFKLDDLLANVMVYYASGSIISSQRYYRENFATGGGMKLFGLTINVPSGYAVFPNELACSPRFLVTETYKNLTTMTYQNDGGHFAAFEQPLLLEKDVRHFVKQVESLYPEKLPAPKGFTAV